MKHILLTFLLAFRIFASDIDISSFKADFTQSITDDKNKTITYKGNVIASNTQDALWNYKTPVVKSVYLNGSKVTIIEPELEQVIIKYIKSNFNFFNMIKNAKKINNNTYIATFNDAKFTIKTEDKKIKSISYLDEFENKVVITFSNQQQNININKDIFIPHYSINFDIVRD